VRQAVGVRGQRVFSTAQIDGGLEGGHGLIVLAEAFLRHAEVIKGFKILGILLDGLAEVGHAARRVLLFELQQAALEFFEGLRGDGEIADRDGAFGFFVDRRSIRFPAESRLRITGEGAEKQGKGEKRGKPHELRRWQIAPNHKSTSTK
jgi:hypothetical protein